jgi:uncharacterized RDD family membrane protein YckC
VHNSPSENPEKMQPRHSSPAVSGRESVAPLPGFFRRLAALAYDALLITGVLLVVSAPFVWRSGGPPPAGLARLAFQLYLFAWIYLFFAWFWVHGGQTLGMRAWRLKLEQVNGTPLTWRHASCRFLAALLSFACAGLGFLWIMHDRERCAWHDRLSGTRVRLLPKRGSSAGAAQPQ